MVSFIHLELRQEHKEDYGKVGESKAELGYRTVNTIMCSLESGYASEGSETEAFQSVLTSVHRNNGQALLKAGRTFY